MKHANIQVLQKLFGMGTRFSAQDIDGPFRHLKRPEIGRFYTVLRYEKEASDE